MRHRHPVRAMAGAVLVCALASVAACSPATPVAAWSSSTASSRTASSEAGRASVAGYLVSWDPRSQATAGEGVLREVSPVWYQPTDGGGVDLGADLAQSWVRAVRADAAARGVGLTPSISNFRNGHWDGALVARLVGDRQLRSAHIAAIVGLVRSQSLSAIDIDYESLPASSRGAYSAFVAELAAALHKVPARLSVTLHAKTTEPGSWAGAQAQDWRAIGAAADEVRVMAYDYSSSESRPGPIAPPSWVDQVLRLATRLVPRERIVLGLATYGYDWPDHGSGEPIQWADAKARASDRGVPTSWDAKSSSPWFRYTDDRGRRHTVWYEDARSLTAKLTLAKRYGVNHMVLWRLGGEDPGIWLALRAPR